jgi:anti-anti-sigma factor
MMSALNVQCDTGGAIAVVTPTGRIDSSTAPGFDVELKKVLEKKNQMVIDLKGVEYISSAGLRAVIKAYQTAKKTGGEVKLASVPEVVYSVLYTVGLDQKISTFATVTEAVASF